MQDSHHNKLTATLKIRLLRIQNWYKKIVNTKSNLSEIEQADKTWKLQTEIFTVKLLQAIKNFSSPKSAVTGFDNKRPKFETVQKLVMLKQNPSKHLNHWDFQNRVQKFAVSEFRQDSSRLRIREDSSQNSIKQSWNENLHNQNMNTDQIDSVLIKK